MTTEEKARAYDEALERARKQRDDYQKELNKTDKNSQLASIFRAAISAVEMAFPELKKSEDEKIRKAIIKSIEEDSSVYEQEVSKEQMLAWLEKLNLDDLNLLKEFNKGMQEAVMWGREGYEVSPDGKVKSLTQDEIDSVLEKQKEQKPVDYEAELEKCKHNFIYFWDKYATVKLKPAKWDEFDEDCLKRAVWYIENPAPSVVKDTNLALWLKSLPGRFNLQPKEELSIEKAIQWLDDTFYFLDNSSGRGRDCEITTHDFDSLEEMYDSFRKAVTIDSQPHWKPSEEQIEALNALNLHGDLSYVGQQNQLISLYQDLKKLM